MNDSTPGHPDAADLLRPSSEPIANSEKDAGGGRVVERLGRGHLHRLLLGHQAGLQVTGEHDAELGDQHRHQGHRSDGRKTVGVRRAGQVPGADRQHEHPGGDEARR